MEAPPKKRGVVRREPCHGEVVILDLPDGSQVRIECKGTLNSRGVPRSPRVCLLIDAPLTVRISHQRPAEIVEENR